MNRTGWLVPSLAVTILSAAAVVGTSYAVGADVATRTAPAAVATAPPVVGGKSAKHGVTLTAAQRRLQKAREYTTPPPERGSDHGRKNRRPRAGKTVADRQVDARRPFRLHAAGCKPTEMEGKVLGPNTCEPDTPEPPDTTQATRRTLPPRVVLPRPEDVSWEQVLAETRSVVFPGLRVKVQPDGRTLVNYETIVYTDDSKISTTTVTLLGFPVVVEATPISYSWRFGDGTPAVTTSTPGRPYPAKDITHKYMRRGGVRLTLTTNYAARFNVANTGWQYVNGTIPVTGPATALQVREAVPVLVDPPG
jgi:hypothetical protein